MGGVVQQLGKPAVKAGIRCFFPVRRPALATDKRFARWPGFRILQCHKLRLPNVRSILNYRLQVAARSNPATAPNWSLPGLSFGYSNAHSQYCWREETLRR